MSASGWLLYAFGWAVVLLLVRVRGRARRGRGRAARPLPPVYIALDVPRRGD